MHAATLIVLAALSLGQCAADSRGLLVIPDSRVMKFDEIGLYRIGYAYRGQPEQEMSIGWASASDDRTGLAHTPLGLILGKNAVMLHPPWRNGTGYSFQEFALALPKCRKITLRGAVGMRAEAMGKSDGCTFRVLVDGRKLFDAHHNSTAWRAFEIDLTPLAGKTAIIRFESDAGPKDNPGWDFALWGDREIAFSGYNPKPIKHKDPPPLDLRKLYSAQNGSVVPPDAFGGKHEMALKDDVATFSYAGLDGTLEYRWSRPRSAADPLLGQIELTAKSAHETCKVPLAGSARIEWTAPQTFVASRWEQSADGVTCVLVFRDIGDPQSQGRGALPDPETPAAEATVRVTGRMVGRSLVLGVSCDKPLVAALNAGDWGPVMRRTQVTVPYYSGQTFYLPAQNLFVNSFSDWTASSAASLENTRAVYAALTDHTRNLLKERVIFTAAWHAGEAMPNIPNPPSPFIKQVGGRIVLDTWGGTYTNIANKLETLAEYGVRDDIALIHVWQHAGYDNGLPTHYPANESLGGEEGMKTLVATGRRLGYLMALHENYSDYYPNYEFFKESDIGLNSDGARIDGWFNGGTRIQAFGVKTNAVVPLARTQSPEIHRRYGTNSCYMDVHSAVPPWFRVDCRAGEPGAGTFNQVWNAYRELWKFEREAHEGPCFGEGNTHWYWSGCLDGAEAQFGSGWPWAGGTTAPLAVDFDLLRIHPLQFNHGMGYYERWGDKLGWGAIPPMEVLDQYRMQEIAYGHAGWLSGAAWSLVPCAWLEHHLMTPVTTRYAAARPVDIRYQVKGKWVDSTAAAKAAVWNRLRVRYDNGLEITANDMDAPLVVNGITLPRFGWLAQGTGVTAYTALRDGVVVDYAETKDSVFANARRATDWELSKVWNIRPRVSSFEQTGPRAFRLTYAWKVGEPIPKDYTCFVHFMGPDPKNGGQDAICFQGDHPLAPPTSRWKTGQTIQDGPHEVQIPDDLADGDYRVTVGLYNTDLHNRVPLLGVPDGTTRVRLGVIRVRDGGKQITFVPEKSAGTQANSRNRRLNETAKVIDFGAVRTNGSVLIRREGSEWVLISMPREKPFEIILSSKRFGAPKSVRTGEGSARPGEGEAPSEPVVNGWWRLRMSGAKEYRWRP